MGNSKELLLIDKYMDSVQLTKQVNIMLTPHFYTIKREVIPVKYAYQAKKIAPSIFEGVLEDNENYRFMVYKRDKEWEFIAYNIKDILDFLLSKNIKPELVSKVYFAQQSVKLFRYNISLNEKDVLTVIDNIVVVVPKAILGDEISTQSVNKSFTPKNGVSLANPNNKSIINLFQAIAFSVVFISFAIIFTLEALRYKKQNIESQNKLNTIFEFYPSLKSSYTRSSIIEKYKTLDSKERLKRDTLKIISNLIFKGVTMTSLTLNEKSFSVEFSCSSLSVVKQLKSLVKDKKYKISRKRGNNLKIEGKF